MARPAASTTDPILRGLALPRIHFLAAVALFTVAALLLSAPWTSGIYTIPWDAKAHFAPQISFLARALHSGDSPFWTPNVFAGHPQIADPQSLIFSPPFFLLALLDPTPSFQAMDGCVFAMLWLGGIGVLLLFRDRGWHMAGALVAALAFAFGGSQAWRIQHLEQVISLSWFPLCLWLLARALERSSFLYGLAAGVVAGFMVLGRDQVAWLCVLFLVAYVIRHFCVRDVGARLRASIAPLAGGLISGVAVIAVPVALTLALAAQSNRSEIDYEGAAKGSLHPFSLLTVFISNLYGVDGPLKNFWGPPSPLWGELDLYIARNMAELFFGSLPAMALLWFGICRGQIFARDIRFYTIASLVLLAYALGRYTPLFRLMFDVPGADLFRRPADATFLFCALWAFVAGYLVHRVLSDARPIRWLSVLVFGMSVAAIFAGSYWLAVSKNTAALALWPLTLSAAFTLAAIAVLVWLPRLRTTPVPAMFLVTALMTTDLAVNAGPNESTALPPVVYDVLRPDTKNDTIATLKRLLAETTRPDRRDRVELAAVDFHWPNATLVHDLDHDLGYNPIRLKLFTDATNASDHLALPEQRQFSPLWPRYRSVFSDMIGLRFVASGVPLEQIDKSFKPGDFLQVGRTKDAYIYENPTALPRVLIGARAQAADFDAMVVNGQWPDIDYRHTVLLQTAPPEPASPRREGTAAIVSYHNTQVVVDADVPDGGWLVLNDVWHPWWFADVDGTPTEILRANVMFRAVALSPGKHRVTFAFRPLDGLLAQWRARKAT